jgi:hypothetical protein
MIDQTSPADLAMLTGVPLRRRSGRPTSASASGRIPPALPGWALLPLLPMSVLVWGVDEGYRWIGRQLI